MVDSPGKEPNSPGRASADSGAIGAGAGTGTDRIRKASGFAPLAFDFLFAHALLALRCLSRAAETHLTRRADDDFLPVLRRL